MKNLADSTSTPVLGITGDIFDNPNRMLLLGAWDDESVWTPAFVTQVKESIFNALTPTQKDEIGVTSPDQLSIRPDGVFRGMLHIGNKAVDTMILTLDDRGISTRTIYPLFSSAGSIDRLLTEHTGIQPYHSPVLDKPSLTAEELFDSARYKSDFDSIVTNLAGLSKAQLFKLATLVSHYAILHQYDLKTLRTDPNNIHLTKDVYNGHPTLVTNVPIEGSDDVLWIFNSGSKE